MFDLNYFDAIRKYNKMVEGNAFERKTIANIRNEIQQKGVKLFKAECNEIHTNIINIFNFC